MKVQLPEMHYHSISCHVPAITVPLTALAYGLFLGTEDSFYNVAHIVLSAVSLLSFFVVFISGIEEREHKYTNWSTVFKGKMLFSILHFAILVYQAVVIIGNLPSIEAYGNFYAVLTIGLQTIFMGAITIMGVITAQGRIGGKDVYKDDEQYKRSYDIIKTVKESQPDPLKENPYDRL